MSLKVKWLDSRQLKFLRIDLNYIASKGLLDTLDDYIGKEFKGTKYNEIGDYLNPLSDVNREGNYLGNIFNDIELRELEFLKENYIIRVL